MSAAEFTAPAPLPRTPAGLARLSLGEFSVGFALGLGVLAVLAGLRLAGELIDQQIGTALGEVFNPMLGGSAATSGQLLGLLGTAVLITLPGVNGHLRLFGTLLDTFRMLPPGAGWVSGEAWRTLAELAGAGVGLGLRVAAPTLAVMSLMSVTVGFLGRTVPQINVMSVGFPMRAAAGMFVLALTLSPATDVLANLLSASLTALHETLVGLPDPRLIQLPRRPPSLPRRRPASSSPVVPDRHQQRRPRWETIRRRRRTRRSKSSAEAREQGQIAKSADVTAAAVLGAAAALLWVGGIGLAENAGRADRPRVSQRVPRLLRRRRQRTGRGDSRLGVLTVKRCSRV